MVRPAILSLLGLYKGQLYGGATGAALRITEVVPVYRGDTTTDRGAIGNPVSPEFRLVRIVTVAVLVVEMKMATATRRRGR